MEDLVSSCFQTPIGEITAVAGSDGLWFVYFSDASQPKFLPIPKNTNHNHHLLTFQKELEGYFLGNIKAFKTPYVLRGTPFQNQTWESLARIPYGKTASYAQMAQAIYRPQSFRAVASANRANNLAVVLPCHRVIRSNGDLCGYNGGVERKKWLLDHEARNT